MSRSSEIEAALRELVACKALIDSIPDDWQLMEIENHRELGPVYADYRRRKPLSWAAAIAALQMPDDASDAFPEYLIDSSDIVDRLRTVQEIRLAAKTMLDAARRARWQFANQDAEIAELRAALAAAEAKIDALMLEYCPDEMTEEQTANWARHQVAARAANKTEQT